MSMVAEKKVKRKVRKSAGKAVENTEDVKVETVTDSGKENGDKCVVKEEEKDVTDMETDEGKLGKENSVKTDGEVQSNDIDGVKEYGEMETEEDGVDEMPILEDPEENSKKKRKAVEEVTTSKEKVKSKRIKKEVKIEEEEDEEEEGKLPVEDEKKDTLEHDTELVSEDELPDVKPTLDTEAVSDEELPPSSAADHLLDTEAVSEDELPPVKKKTESSHDKEESGEDGEIKSSTKRGSTSVSDSNEVQSKKATSDSKNKPLPELEKYWKVVKEDPADFTGWTYLLQYVDQEHDVEATREAYDTFLSHYPYCYGYWRKYADYEKKKGDKSKSEEVFERGLAAIPLSVDLWLHYLNHIKMTRKEDEDYIRTQYERALDICGIEFRSDRLWDSYIKWETEGKNISNVRALYDKLFLVPTQNYKMHFENFESFVMSNQPNKMLDVDEFLTMRSEVIQKLRQKPPSETAPAANAPPGDESEEEAEKSPKRGADEETKLMREKIIASRKKIFKAMAGAVQDRWNFEEGIKRPYFHVKPLERCQLNNWRDYLEYEIGQGDKERTIVLFERCLIACALYDEFWVKYIRYLETLNGDEIKAKIRSVYERACTIHHPKKPMISLNWAYFEESEGFIDAARKILTRIEKEVPNSLQIAICRINLERRVKDFEEASRLYEHYISNIKNKYATNALSIKYARFCQKVLNDVDRGSDILRKAIEKDRDNPRLYHQLLDLVFSKTPTNPQQEEECVGIIDEFLERDSTDIEHKVLFAQHKVEYLEDFGSTVSSVQKAVSDYMNLLKQMKEKRRKQYEEKIKNEEKKLSSSSGVKGEAQSSSSPGASSATNYSSSYPGSSYVASSSSTAAHYQSPSSYTQQPAYSQYPASTDQTYSSYQNWNYSQTAASYSQNYNQGWGSYNYY